MKRLGWKVFRFGIVLGIVTLVLYGTAVLWTGRTLERSLAQIPKPPMVAYHEALGRAQAEGAGAALEADRHRIARYQTVFKRILERDGIRKLNSLNSERGEAPYHTWEPSERDEVATIITAFRPELEEIHALAASGGPFVALGFGERITPDNAMRGEVLFMGLLLRWSMVVHIAEGRGSAGVADGVATLALGNLLAEEPRIFAQLNRYRHFHLFYDAIVENGLLGYLSRDELAVLLAALEGQDNHQGLVNGLLGEQYAGTRSYDAFLRSGWAGRAAILDGTYRGGRDTLWAGLYGYFSPVFRAHHNRQMIAHIGLMGLAVEASRDPYFEATSKWEALEAAYGNAPFGLLVQNYKYRVEHIGLSQAWHDESVHLLRLALSLEIFHRDAGRYPDALEEMVPVWPEGLPRDPFCGEGYRYMRQDDDAYLLYGVGQNLVDDGGVEGDDAVWRAGGLR